MSLLKLSPEATRLRRVAKACAAGELSRLEYRAARRQVISKFVEAADEVFEDTVPRFDLDITQRRNLVASEAQEVVGRQNWLVWLLLGTVLLAGLTLPVFTYAAAQGTSGLQIPPVSDRDPNPSTAPRYQLDSVVWLVPDDLAENHSAAANKFLADRLSEIQIVNTPATHGFSAAELEEVGRFLNALGVHDAGSRVTNGDVQDLAALIASQKTKRGISLVQLEQLAQELQVWIRERGYPLAQAYVPAQSVQDRTVELGVQFGTLTSIAVTGTKSSAMKYRLANLLGQRVQRNNLETKLNSLNRSGGIRAQVSFSPGGEVGGTEMLLHVHEEKRFAGSVQLDNYGVEALGEERLALVGHWNSPRGVGDVLSASAFTTLDPGDHQFAQVGYTSPILNGRYDAAAQIAYADIGLSEGISFEGDGTLYDISVTDTQLFTRTKRREITVGVGVHDLNWNVVPGQRAWFGSVEMSGHRLFDSAKVALTGSVQGLFGGLDNQRAGQDDRFWRVRAQLSGWTPVTLPWIDVEAKLAVDLQLQAAADLLPPTLRLGGTGPNANKGFVQGQLLLDQGAALTTALRFDAPLGEWWLYMDNTYGELEGLTKRWVQLSSLGLGWEAQLLTNPLGNLSSRVTVGYPISHKGRGGVEDDGTQFYWSLRFAR